MANPTERSWNASPKFRSCKQRIAGSILPNCRRLLVQERFFLLNPECVSEVASPLIANLIQILYCSMDTKSILLSTQVNICIGMGVLFCRLGASASR